MITELVVDEYQGAINQRKNIQNPKWSEINKAITSLNNDTRSSLAIIDHEDSVMGIGGGKPLYHVSVDAPPSSFCLSNGSDNTDLIDIIIGGISTELPANLLVDLKTALQAAKEFSQGTWSPDAEGWIEV